MAGLTGRTWEDSYKNVIILDDTTWTGVKSTLTPLKDGAGVELPLSVSADALKVKSGKYFYFGDSGDIHIRNTDINNLRMTAPTITLYGRVVTPAGAPISAVSIIGGNASIGTIKGTAISGFTRVKGTTISGTTLKGGTTKIDSTGVSAVSIKVGNVVVGTGKSITLTSGAVILRGGTLIDNDAAFLRFKSASQIIVLMSSAALYPNTADAKDLGKSSGGRWRNLYAASAILKSGTASSFNVYAGTILAANTVSGTTVKADYVTAEADVAIKNGQYLYLNGATKTIGLRNNSTMIQFVQGATILNVNNSNEIYPSVNNTGKVGTTSNRFNIGYFTLLNCASNVDLDGATIFMKNLPTASGGLTSGQLYTDSNVVKVKA